MKKQAIFSMRLNRDMKRALETLAEKEHRSLSSFVENIFAEYLAEKGIEWDHQERRSYPRKVIELPARFRIPGRQTTEEHEVYLRDISPSGAYAISRDITGIERLLKNRGMSIKAQLVIRIPHREEPLTLSCEIVRLSIDRSTVGFGLEYKRIREEERSMLSEGLLAAV